MDEILTWKEVSDPSLLHLYYAIQHGADGGMPLFYTTAWVWAKAFGTGVLTLRMYSCISLCGALVITWRTIRRLYGMWATGFGILAMWGASGLLLDQNVEARFYGLYMLLVALAVNVYARLVTEPAHRSLLLLTTLCQAGLVLSHVLGILYGALILLALIVFDATKHRFRFNVYSCHVAGWLALLVWVPAVRASMAVGKPHSWIKMPSVRDLLTGYLFQSLSPWLSHLRDPAHSGIFMVVRCTTALVVVVPLVSVFFLDGPGSLPLRQRMRPDPGSALLFAAYALLLAPIILFALSHFITPVFVPRYFLPSGIGLAIVLTAFAERLGADTNSPRLAARVAWVSIVVLLLSLPVLSTLSLPPGDVDTSYLDVRRLDNVVPPNATVAVDWANDFLKIMRYSHGPVGHYYFLLDWPTSLKGPIGMVSQYHLMEAYRENGYYADNIRESQHFLCSHNDFLVLESEQSWFELTIENMPQFEWRVVDSFYAPEVNRKLISVHRRAPLAFCDQR